MRTASLRKLTVGAVALDTIFLMDRLPTAPGKYLPIQTVRIAQGMATAQAATIVSSSRYPSGPTRHRLALLR